MNGRVIEPYIDESRSLNLTLMDGGPMQSLHTHLESMPMEYSSIEKSKETLHRVAAKRVYFPKLRCKDRKIFIEFFEEPLQALHRVAANSLGSYLEITPSN